VRTVDLWRDRYVPLIAETLPLLPRKSRAWLGAEAAAFERGGGTERAPRVLIHGDIAAPHLLLDGDLRLAAVIDFGDALVADPALDFAGILNNFSAGFLDEVLAHYGPTDPDAARRTAFYIEVAPIFQVVYGDRVRGGAERRAGVRRIAARAGHR
jgi:aminoglycoside phosphotransferase (APT) family kinase protein